MPLNIAFIRGQYINNFELQSYYPIKKNKLIKITGISSLKPMQAVKIPTIKLPSPVDLPNFPCKFPILNRLFIDAMYLHGLERELKSYHIAHTCETFFHFSFQAAVARHRNYVKKLLVTCYEPIPFNHETIWGRKAMKQYVKSSADHFHCVTQRAKDCLLAENVNPDKITVIPYGIELETFKPKLTPNFAKLNPQTNNNSNLSSSVNHNHQPINLLFVGRLEAQKGVYELLEAWQQLKKECPHLNLKIVGKGHLQTHLVKHHLTPETYPYARMPAIYSQADILIHPPKRDRYWEESYGMVLLEAMASKLAIVTTNNGAIPEVVGDAAKIVEQGNAKALYKGVKALLDQPQKINVLAELGYQRALKLYDSNKQAEKLASLYLQLAS